MSHIYISVFNLCRVIARPATYQQLIEEARKAFPDISSVRNLVMLYQPDDVALNKEVWVELDPSAYGAVPDKAVLYVNVQLPITKEYILPLPHQDPDTMPKPQARDGISKSAESNAEAQVHAHASTKVSRTASRAFSQNHTGGNSVVPQAARPGGDAFGSGWGVASARFRQSARFIPNLKDCQNAIGLDVGESNGYPESDEEQQADNERFCDAPQPFPAASHQKNVEQFAGSWVGNQNGSQIQGFGTWGGSVQGDGGSYKNQSMHEDTFVQLRRAWNDATSYQPATYHQWDNLRKGNQNKQKSRYGPHITKSRHCSRGTRSTASSPVRNLTDGSINIIESDHRVCPQSYQQDIPAGTFYTPDFPEQQKTEPARHGVGEWEQTWQSLAKQDAESYQCCQQARDQDPANLRSYAGYEPLVHQQPMAAADNWSPERLSDQFAGGADGCRLPRAVRSSSNSSRAPSEAPPPSPHINPANPTTGSPLKSRAKARASTAWARQVRKKTAAADGWATAQILADGGYQQIQEGETEEDHNPYQQNTAVGQPRNYYQTSDSYSQSGNHEPRPQDQEGSQVHGGYQTHGITGIDDHDYKSHPATKGRGVIIAHGGIHGNEDARPRSRSRSSCAAFWYDTKGQAKPRNQQSDGHGMLKRNWGGPSVSLPAPQTANKESNGCSYSYGCECRYCESRRCCRHYRRQNTNAGERGLECDCGSDWGKCSEHEGPKASQHW